MKIALVAINSKYIHSNLAVYSLKAYAAQYSDSIEIQEYTINQRAEIILSKIYCSKPDVVAFSTYIWNVEMVKEIAKELKKVMPSIDIWLGGPEVSYDAELILKENSYLTGVMCGEGELTFAELAKAYVTGSQYTNIAGIVYQNNSEIISNSCREPLDMNTLVFPYEDVSAFDNKILYYESSRGCPFSCSYCLSSIDKSVRFKSAEKVKQELSIFLKAKVKQVKFVDRTFNCKKTHAMEIWKYIDKNDNGITNFHFEISADLIDDEMIDFLRNVRANLFQFEIGVQTINQATIKEIRRTMNLDRLKTVVERLNQRGNIHLHLDLIAGLPYEDFNSFVASFNYVYSLRPEQLQLGFLKVLKGSYMYDSRKRYAIQHRDNPPYEVLQTEYISYDEILTLKAVEEMVESYYNSNQFRAAIKYALTKFDSPFDFYRELASFYAKKGIADINHSRINRYNILLDFVSSLQGTDLALFKELLLYDLYTVERLNKRPLWAKFEEAVRNRVALIYHNNKSVLDVKTTHIEICQYDILGYINGGAIEQKESILVFDYMQKDKIFNQTAVYQILGL